MRVDPVFRRLGGVISVLAWSVAVVAGMVAMVRYQSRPSDAAAASVAHRNAPTRWPDTVRIARDPHRATLIMMLHPHCPCSRASVHELALLMSHAGDRVTANVLFVWPNGAPSDWLNTDLWNEASAIPGVNVIVDANGADSLALGAITSGAVTLYDAGGTLRFTGGITDGRGHEGDNAGLDAVLSVLREERQRATAATKTITTPVYGCPLRGPHDICRGTGRDF